MLDTRSETNMQGVIPSVVAAVRRAASTLAASGTFLCVYAPCLRTAAMQNADYAQGRTTPGHIITNAKANQSMHCYGLAVDVVPYLRGPAGALNWNVSTPQFHAMVSALKNEGLAWGGDWKHFPDMDHFQVAALPPNPTGAMMADYGDGSTANIDAVWDNLAQGKYAETPAQA